MNSMVLSQEQRLPIISWGNIFLLFFAMYPYIFLLNMLLPIKFIGFNFYFAVTTVVLAMFFTVMLRRYQNKVLQQVVIFAILIFFGFLILHLFVENTYSPSMLMSNRIGITLIFYLFVSLAAIKILGKNKISKVIIINAFVQSVIGIIHYHFFSNIVTGSALVPQGQLYVVLEKYMYLREPGILISASLFAHMILLGLFVYASKIKNNNLNRKNIFKSLVFVSVCLYGVFLARSRFPSIIGFILAGYIFIIYLKSHMRFNLTKILSLSVIIAALFLPFVDYILPEFNSVLIRLSNEGMGVRTVKNTLAMNVMMSDLSSLLIGAKQDVIGAAVSTDGIGISDNSILAVGMNFGLVYLILLIMLVTFLLKITVRLDVIGMILIATLVLNLFLTNAIYWDIYLLYFFATLYVVSNKKNHNYNFEGLR